MKLQDTICSINLDKITVDNITLIRLKRGDNLADCPFVWIDIIRIQPRYDIPSRHPKSFVYGIRLSIVFLGNIANLVSISLQYLKGFIT